MPETEYDVPLDAAPGARIAEAVTRFGEQSVAERAASLLMGANEGEEFLLWVGGQHAQGVLDGAPPLYWPEVWGARALTFVWVDSAAAAVHRGLTDQAWRVREMCCRVVLLRKLPETDALLTIVADENPRVRVAAARALGAVADEASAKGALTAALQDPEKDVRRAAHDAMVALQKKS